MSKSIPKLMSGTVEDFESDEKGPIIAAAYIVGSIMSIVLNSIVIFTVFKSQRMASTPKYWLVIVVCVTLWLQAAMMNPQIVVNELEANADTSCHLWLSALIFNRYICVGLICWVCFYIHLDYFLCVTSSTYSSKFRSKMIALALFASITLIIGLIVYVCYRYGSLEKPWSGLRCHFDLENQTATDSLSGITVYGPLAGSLLLTLFSLILRRSKCLKSLLMNRMPYLEQSIDVYGFGTVGKYPIDNGLFLLIILLFMAPSVVFQHLMETSTIKAERSAEGFSLAHVASAVAVMRDVGGCLIPLIWYCFSDMRMTLLKLTYFRRTLTHIDEAFSDTSEFRTYECYPYCANVDL